MGVEPTALIFLGRHADCAINRARKAGLQGELRIERYLRERQFAIVVPLRSRDVTLSLSTKRYDSADARVNNVFLLGRPVHGRSFVASNALPLLAARRFAQDERERG